MALLRPIVTNGAGKTTLNFEDEQVTVYVERLREKNDNVSGEITVLNTAPGQAPYLHGGSRLSLTSASSRKSITSYLKTRRDDLDWEALFEVVCGTILRKHRQGEPLVDVGDQPDPDAPRWRMFPLLMEGQANMIYGAGGSGKSYTSCLIATLVQNGRVHCGLRPQTGNVLYLDYETSREEINGRIKAVNEPIGISDPRQIKYRFCSQPLVNEIEEVQQWVHDYDIKLVIVDSVGMACGGEAEASDPVLRYFTALRSLRVTTLSIDHVAKNAETKSPYGSVYKVNSCRSVWELKKVQEVGDEALSIGLYHRKVNNGRLLKPLGLTLTFFEDDDESFPRVQFEREDVATIPGLAQDLPIKDRIRHCLESHKVMTPDELSSELDAKVDSIKHALKRGERKVFVQLMDNKWGLVRL